MGGAGRGRGGDVIENSEKTIDYCEQAPCKSVSSCRFPFRWSDKKQDRFSKCIKKTKVIYFGKL